MDLADALQLSEFLEHQGYRLLHPQIRLFLDVFGDEACLALARAWLGRGEPERARAVLAPLLAVADRVPWLATLAATLAVDGLALLRLGQDQQARAQLLRAEHLARGARAPPRPPGGAIVLG